MDFIEIQQALERCEFFMGLQSSDTEEIARLCRVAEYQPGDYVFRQGDFGEFIYIIMEGHIFLERSMDLDQQKGNVVIGMLGKGRVFGCWSTLLDEPHNLMSSAVCQKPTIVITVKGSDLREMMLNNSSFGFNVLEKLCFLLRDRIQGAYGALEKI